MAFQYDFQRIYVPPSVAETLSDSPRWGNTRDIATLVSDSNNSNNTMDINGTSSEYATGLVVAAAITAVSFAVVAMLICICKCCGSRRVGFASGQPFHVVLDKKQQQQRERPLSNDDTSRGCCQSSSSPQSAPPISYSSTPGLVRGTFILSGTLVIVFAVLLVTQGLTNVQDTVRTARNAAADVEALTTDASTLLDTGVRSLASVAENVQQKLGTELTNFCPANPELTDNNLARTVQTQAAEASVLLQQLRDFIDNDVDDVVAALDEAKDGAVLVQDELGEFDVTDWRALLILIPSTLIPCLLVAAAILVHFDVRLPGWCQCMLSWMMMPLLILMVMVCAVTASAAIAAGSANSDFCLPQPRDGYSVASPDTTVFRILDLQGYPRVDGLDLNAALESGATIDTNAVVRQVADHYIGQCNLDETPDPFVILDKYVPEMETSKESLDDLANNLLTDSALLELSVYCDRDFDSVETLLSDLQLILGTLLSAITQTRDLVSCERIVPLYHRVVYDGACRFSVQALFWIFCAALIMGTFGLVMIWLRAAYQPTVYLDANPEATANTNNDYYDNYRYDPDQRIQEVEPYYEDNNTMSPTLNLDATTLPPYSPQYNPDYNSPHAQGYEKQYKPSHVY